MNENKIDWDNYERQLANTYNSQLLCITGIPPLYLNLCWPLQIQLASTLAAMHGAESNDITGGILEEKTLDRQRTMVVKVDNNKSVARAQYKRCFVQSVRDIPFYAVNQLVFVDLADPRPTPSGKKRIWVIRLFKQLQIYVKESRVFEDYWH